MTALREDVTATLAALQVRWGPAAPRRLGGPAGTLPGMARDGVGEVIGALATVPLPVPAVAPQPRLVPGSPAPASPEPGRVVPTGFAALDAILPGGLPRSASVGLRGAPSSGTTTLALRLVAQAQASGLIAAWLDLSASFDPVEAVARGVAPEWLLVVTPTDLDEGLSIAASLLAGRSVDLLIVDLPAERSPRPSGAQSAGSRPGFGERLGRLAALARRADALFVVIEPPRLASGLDRAVAAATSLRLELARQSWIHLGRDVVGQRTAVTIARSRFGPPGRSAELAILYAEGGERDVCLQREELLREAVEAAHPVAVPQPSAPLPLVNAPAAATSGFSANASSPSLLATSPPRSRHATLRLVAGGPGRGGRPAMVTGQRSGREPGGAGARRPARDPTRLGAPSRP